MEVSLDPKPTPYIPIWVGIEGLDWENFVANPFKTLTWLGSYKIIKPN